ncbi:MAG: hypothetical protein HYX86_03530 [Chloroflexi bacterium]|nr:hypothetical protein [Chloroflexota bacterium]
MMTGVSFDNPKGFLVYGGAILLLLGIVGFIVPGLLGELLWFDNSENVAHTVLGIVGLAAAFYFPMSYQRLLVGILAVVALFFGIYPWILPAGSYANQVFNFYGLANLESPLDNLVHLVVGIWAAWVYYKSGQSAMMMAK